MTTARKNVHSPKLRIEVEEDIIAESAQRDSSHCMIAEAVQRAVPTARYISVDLATIRFSDPAAGYRYIYLTPRIAQMALLDFDQGEKPKPFSFEIRGAHVLPTGTGNRGRVKLEPSASGGTPPVRVGGKAPPIGPLTGTTAAGANRNRRNKRKVDDMSEVGRLGRRREFGLRAIIR